MATTGYVADQIMGERYGPRDVSAPTPKENLQRRLADLAGVLSVRLERIGDELSQMEGSPGRAECGDANKVPVIPGAEYSLDVIESAVNGGLVTVVERLERLRGRIGQL